MKKSIIVVLALVTALAFTGMVVAQTATPEQRERMGERAGELRNLMPKERGEMREHPRIATAIRQLEDAIAYMEQAPHDFGGHKAEAIEASKKAVKQLQKAIKYRAKKEHD